MLYPAELRAQLRAAANVSPEDSASEHGLPAVARSEIHLRAKDGAPGGI